MEKLPIEILDTILQYCDNRDLKAVRLASKALHSPILPRHFRCICVSVNPESFRNLRQVSRHPQIRQWVRELKYDTQIFRDYLGPSYEWDIACRQVIHDRCSILFDFERALQTQMDLPEAQEEIGTKSNGSEELALAVSRLPLLESIYLHSGGGPFEYFPYQPEDMKFSGELPKTRRVEICNAVGGWETLNSKTLDLLGSLSGVRQPLKSLTLNSVRWDFLNCSRETLMSLYRLVKGIRVMSLGIKVPRDWNMLPEILDGNCGDAASCVGEFLRHATNLETLTLTFYHVYHVHFSEESILIEHCEAPGPHLDRKIMKSLVPASCNLTPWLKLMNPTLNLRPWAKLKDLALNNTSFKSADLKCLIEACSLSIKRFRLSNIHLTSGSWLRMLRLIPDLISTHQLEQLRLTHELTSAYEHWVVKPRIGSECSQNLLRNQIERWVEDGGKKCGRLFPLLPDFIPPCVLHSFPIRVRLLELQRVCFEGLQQGDKSFVWRYDELRDREFWGRDLRCSTKCKYWDGGKTDPTKDFVEDHVLLSEVFVEPDHLIDSTDRFQYVIDEDDDPVTQEIGWAGMVEFDPPDVGKALDEDS